MTDNKIVSQALALINDCNKYKMDLTTYGVVITDAIKFVQTNKEKPALSAKEQLEEKQEEETGELEEEEQKPKNWNNMI